MSAITFQGPAGSLLFLVNETDGSVGTIDLTETANALLAGGHAEPRSTEDQEQATSTLGEIAWTEEAVFSIDGEPMDTATAVAVLADGLLRAIRVSLDRFEASLPSPPESK